MTKMQGATTELRLLHKKVGPRVSLLLREVSQRLLLLLLRTQKVGGRTRADELGPARLLGATLQAVHPLVQLDRRDMVHGEDLAAQQGACGEGATPARSVAPVRGLFSALLLGQPCTV